MSTDTIIGIVLGVSSLTALAGLVIGSALAGRSNSRSTRH